MILTFPRRSEVRALVEEEINRRGGAIGAIAESYAEDSEITSRLLRVLGPQPEGSREHLVSALQMVASVNDDAFATLEAAREDTEGSISSEATIGWVEALLARGAFEIQHVEALMTELDAVRPAYDARRAAAVVGLAIAGRLDRFAAATGASSSRRCAFASSCCVGWLRCEGSGRWSRWHGTSKGWR